MDVKFDFDSASDDDDSASSKVRILRPKKRDPKTETFIAAVCARVPCTQLLEAVAAAAAKTERFAEQLAGLPEAERELLSRSAHGQDLVDVALAFEDLRAGLQRLRTVLCRQPCVMVPNNSGRKPWSVDLDLKQLDKYPVLVSLGTTASEGFLLLVSTHDAVRDKATRFLEVTGRLNEMGSTRYQEKTRMPRGLKADAESEAAAGLRSVLVEQLGILRLRVRTRDRDRQE
jgi:hypothetical protein